MKILFFADHLMGGGAEIITLRLSRELASRGHRVTIIVLNLRGCNIAIPDGIEIIDLALGTDWSLGSVWRPKRLTRNEAALLMGRVAEMSPDLVVISFMSAHWLGPLFKGYNTWHWIHGMWSLPIESTDPLRYLNRLLKSKIRAVVFRHIFRGRRIVCLSRGHAERLSLSVQPKELRVIPNGVDVAQIRKVGPPLRDAQATWQAMYLGRLSHEKQPDHALKAFVASGLRGRMAFVGSGPMLSKVQRLAHRLGVQERVDFCGWVDDPIPLLRQSRCLVISSATEGLPLNLLEALALGVPVATYDCSPGIRETFERCSLQRGLVPTGNIENLGAAIREAVNAPLSGDIGDGDLISLSRMAKAFEELQ